MPVNKEYIISSGNDIKDICDYFEFYGANVDVEFDNISKPNLLFHVDKDWLVFDKLDGEVSQAIISDPNYKEVKLPAYKFPVGSFVSDVESETPCVVLMRTVINNIPNYVLEPFIDNYDKQTHDWYNNELLLPEDALVGYEFQLGDLVRIKYQPEIYLINGFKIQNRNLCYILVGIDEPVHQDDLMPYKPLFVTEDIVRVKGTSVIGQVHDLKLKGHEMLYLVAKTDDTFDWVEESKLEYMYQPNAVSKPDNEGCVETGFILDLNRGVREYDNSTGNDKASVYARSEQAYMAFAMAKASQLIVHYYEGWVPPGMDGYGIIMTNYGDVIAVESKFEGGVLRFHTLKLALRFLKEHEDLAYDIYGVNNKKYSI